MRRLVPLILFGLAGCLPLSAPEIVSSGETAISIKSGTSRNPGALAATHCGQFDKTAALIDTKIIGYQGFQAIFYFSCD